jgi:hypothetical protein
MQLDPSRLNDRDRQTWEKRVELYGADFAAGQFTALARWVERLKPRGDPPEAVREAIIGSFWDSNVGMQAPPTVRFQAIRLIEAMLAQILEEQHA